MYVNVISGLSAVPNVIKKKKRQLQNKSVKDGSCSTNTNINAISRNPMAPDDDEHFTQKEGYISTLFLFKRLVLLLRTSKKSDDDIVCQTGRCRLSLKVGRITNRLGSPYLCQLQAVTRVRIKTTSHIENDINVIHM